MDFLTKHFLVLSASVTVIATAIAAIFIASYLAVFQPYNFPGSDGDMHNPVIGRGVYSGGESEMERFARGVTWQGL